ncbi:MAG TPA: serine/threonine-protein kinase, partial [Anaerolineaceae bacterium]|nr:serine/threonine-protein kinase [Anaerolineaceae bacterium]
RYHILEELGEGGMAVVYKAYDTRLETEVAVKVIRLDNLPRNAEERALKRFEREAKEVARLNHPNIVKVTDYGEHEGSPYLVMPYLPGGTLKQRLKEQGRMEWREAARLLAPVADALAYAHEMKLIHRDVKPSNILLTAQSRAMLTDFGVAKVLDEEITQDLTGTSATVGTPEYMAPEQVMSKTVDHRADIYSLGVVFYEMLTGRRPYEADTPMAVLFKHASAPLPRPKEWVGDLPDEVERVLLKALAKRPEDRYADMAAFAAALEGLERGAQAVETPAIAKLEPLIEPIAEPNATINQPDKESASEQEPLSEPIVEPNATMDQVDEESAPEQVPLHLASGAGAAPDSQPLSEAEKQKKDGLRDALALEGEETTMERKPRKWVVLTLIVIGAIIAVALIAKNQHEQAIWEATKTAMARATRTAVAQATETAMARATAMVHATEMALSTRVQVIKNQMHYLAGPLSGELEHVEEDGFVKETYLTSSPVKDFWMEATFYNPYSASTHAWDFGVLFRDYGDNDAYRLIISSGSTWELRDRKEDDSEIIHYGELTNLRFQKGEPNRVELVVQGSTGYFYLNGEFISQLDLSSRKAAGELKIGTGFYNGSELTGEITRYEDVWVFASDD